MSLSPYFQPTAGGDTVFSVESAKIKFGCGALEEIGADALALNMARVAVYTDPNVAKLEPVSVVVAALKKQGIDVAVFEEAEIEPTDRSFKAGPHLPRTENSTDLFRWAAGPSWTPARLPIYILAIRRNSAIM